MPEDKACKLPLPPRGCDNRKQKKKRRKKCAASSTSPQSADKPQTASMPPETSTVSPSAPRGLDEDAGAELRASSEKDGERCTRSGRRTRRTSRAPSQGHTSELGGRGSLRWEGVLEDPRAEEQRLELYRADRRRRYIAHREALLKEGGDGLKQTCVKKSSETKALTEADHQVTPLLLHLSMES